MEINKSIVSFKINYYNQLKNIYYGFKVDNFRNIIYEINVWNK